MKGLIDRYMSSYLRLVVLIVISIMAGLSLLLSPENVSHLVIRFVGVIWVIDGINYIGLYKLKRLKDKSDTEEWVK